MDLPTIATAYFVLLVFSTISLASGYLVLASFSDFKNVPFRGRVATSFLIGTIICIVVEALLVTRFNTVFSITTVLAFYYLLQKRNAITNPFKTSKTLITNDLKELTLPILAFATIIFGAHYFVYFLDSGWVETANKEWAYYALAANSLNVFGVENISMVKNIAQDLPASYYHYFDLWLVEIVGHYSGLSYGLGLVLVVFPIFIIGVVLFIWAFMPARNIFAYIWPFIILASVSFISWKPIASYAFFSELPIYEFGILTERSKRIYYLMWIILAATYLLKLNRNSNLAMFFLCLLPVAHFGMIPFLCAFVFLLVFFRFLSLKRSLLFAATIVLICIFYFVLNSSSGSALTGTVLAFPDLRAYLFTAVKIVVKNIGLTALTTVHVLLLLAWLWRKGLMTNQAIWTLVLGLAASLGVWGILHFLFDSVQLFMVPFKALFMSVSIVLLATTYHKVSLRFKGAVVAVGVLSLILIPPENQVYGINCPIPKISDEKVEVIGFILPKENYSNETKLSMQFNIPWLDLPFKSKNKFPVSVTEVADTTFDNYVKLNFSDRAYGRYRRSSAYHFYTHQGGKESLKAFKEVMGINQVIDCR